MLKQIVEEMYVPEEILTNLTEADKQLIFLLIRKEQVKRYNDWVSIVGEAKFEHKPNSRGKNIAFVSENELVTVLGERAGDKPIEEILRLEALEKARIEAEKSVLNEVDEMKNDSVDSAVAAANVSLSEETLHKNEEQNTDERTTTTMITTTETKVTKKPPPTARKPPMRPPKPMNEKQNVLIKRMSQELYHHMLQNQKSIEEQALEQSIQIDSEYEKQEELSKKHDEERKNLAIRARENLVNIVNENIPPSTEETTAQTSTKGKFAPVRPPKSNNIRLKYIIDMIQKSQLWSSSERPKKWFLDNEWNKKKIFNGSVDHVPIWFHGIITKQFCENLLSDCELGSFLVRVSEKFPGYVLSFVAHQRIKHVLIEAKENLYQFFGDTNYVQFNTLEELIAHYQKNPINKTNNEILGEPRGQDPSLSRADFMDLLYPSDISLKSTSSVNVKINT